MEGVYDMNYLLLILLGVITWQMVTLIVLVVTNEDEDKVIRIGCGLPLVIANSIMWVLRVVRKKYIRKNYELVHIFNENGNFIKNVRVKKGTLHKYYHKGENKYYIEEFIPKINQSVEHADKITKVEENGWFCQEWINENLVKEN